MLQNLTIRQLLAISLGAIAGALIRYYLTFWLTLKLGTNFPYGTFFINLSGCAAMGFVTGWMGQKTIVPQEVRLMISTGFLGAYTTFSTYSLESLALVEGGDFFKAVFYWLGSAVLGVTSLYLGIAFARYLL